MQKCARCEQTFECGIEQGRSTCWCYELPHILPVCEEAKCLCPDCLKKEIEAFKNQKNGPNCSKEDLA